MSKAVMNANAETLLFYSAASLAVVFAAWQFTLPTAATWDKTPEGERQRRLAYLRKLRPITTRLESQTGYFHKFVEAIGALESDWGASRFAVEGRNYFGMRKGSWTGAVVYRNPLLRTEPFRAYASDMEGVNDHVDLIVRRFQSKYGKAYAYAQAKHPGFFQAFEDSGYAIGPDGKNPEKGYGVKAATRYAQILEAERNI